MPVGNISKRFGEQIKAVRKERGLTQEQLSFEAEKPREYIAKVERGAISASLDNAGRIAAALDMKLSELLGQAGL